MATATTAAPSRRRRALRSPGDRRADAGGSSPPPLGDRGVRPAGGLEGSATSSVDSRRMLVGSRSGATVPAPGRKVTPLPGPGPGPTPPVRPTPVPPPTSVASTPSGVPTRANGAAPGVAGPTGPTSVLSRCAALEPLPDPGAVT